MLAMSALTLSEFMLFNNYVLMGKILNLSLSQFSVKW